MVRLGVELGSESLHKNNRLNLRVSFGKLIFREMERPKKEQPLSRGPVPMLSSRGDSEWGFHEGNLTSSMVCFPTQNVGHWGLGPLSLPVGAAFSPGCHVSAQIDLPTRGSKTRHYLRKPEPGHIVSTLQRIHFSGRWSSCVEHMSNDDELTPAQTLTGSRRGPSIKEVIQLPPKLGDRMLSPSVWCWALR